MHFHEEQQNYFALPSIENNKINMTQYVQHIFRKLGYLPLI